MLQPRYGMTAGGAPEESSLKSDKELLKKCFINYDFCVMIKNILAVVGLLSGKARNSDE